MLQYGSEFLVKYQFTILLIEFLISNHLQKTAAKVDKKTQTTKLFGGNVGYLKKLL